MRDCAHPVLQILPEGLTLANAGLVFTLVGAYSLGRAMQSQLSLPSRAARAQTVKIVAKRANVYIERSEAGQTLNFDFLQEHQTADRLILRRYGDGKEQEVNERIMNGGGDSARPIRRDKIDPMASLRWE